MEEQGRHESVPHSHSSQRKPRKRRKLHIFRKILLVIWTLFLVGCLTGVMILGIFATFVQNTLMPKTKVNADDYTMELTSIIYSQNRENGQWEELQRLYGDQNRIWVSYDKIPEAMSWAAVSIEDRRFYEHHGVDWKRTAHATANLFLHSNSTFGGSTITQQLLKNMTGADEGTVNRKVLEIFRALEFEKNYSKDDILELYLNTIYLGQKCYGVQTAAQFYFGKEVSDLSIAECASIIAITNNPSMYGPMSTVTIKNKETGVEKTARQMNKDRQENILWEMWDQGYITEAQYRAAKAEKLEFTDGSVSASELAAAAAETEGTDAGTATRKPGINSWFVDQVYTDVAQDLAAKEGISVKEAKVRVRNSGYSIYSTVDTHIQEIAESVYQDVNNLNKGSVTSASGQKLHSAITIVEPSTGNVVAMVGDVGPKEQNLIWNYATDKHQVGSSVKPLTVYAPALDAGVITMASTFDNYPVQELNGSPWPKNSPSGYKGWTTLANGVAHSVNTIAVRTEQAIGVENAYVFATENLNLPLVPDDMNLAALGMGGLTYGLSTQDMAAAYATFANGGIYNKPRLYLRVLDASGNVVLENEPETRVAMKDTTAYFMTKLLKGTMNFGTGASYRLNGMTCAGKTGTTSNNHVRYFVGYTPYYCAAVWTGYKNVERINAKESNPSAGMWKQVMQRIADELENKDFEKPSAQFVNVSVCMDSGLKATAACAADLRGSRVQTVEVLAGTAPAEECTMHVMRDYCEEGQCLAGEFCPEESVKQVAFLDCQREVFGDLVADDNAYLLSTVIAASGGSVGEDGVETPGVCPVHTTAVDPIVDPDNPFPWEPDGGWTPGTDPGVVQPPVTDPNAPGYDTVPDPPKEPETPSEPAEPEPPPDDAWWNDTVPVV